MSFTFSLYNWFSSEDRTAQQPNKIIKGNHIVNNLVLS